MLTVLYIGYQLFLAGSRYTTLLPAASHSKLRIRRNTGEIYIVLKFSQETQLRSASAIANCPSSSGRPAVTPMGLL
jgi:hypothetical protein